MTDQDKNQTVSNLDLTKQAALHLQQTYGLSDELAEQLLEKARQDISTILTNMTTANKSGDLDTLSKVAHSLKGTLLNLGFNALAEMASEVEKTAGAGNECDQQTVTDLVKTIQPFLHQ